MRTRTIAMHGGAVIRAFATAFRSVVFSLNLCLLPVLFIWIFEENFSFSPFLVWGFGVAVWFLGHGTVVTVALPDDLVHLAGQPNGHLPFLLSFWFLGITLITVFLGFRTGLRYAQLKHMFFHVCATVIWFSIFSFTLAMSLQTSATIALQFAQATLVPTFIYGASLWAGWIRGCKRKNKSMFQITLSNKKALQRLLFVWEDAAEVVGEVLAQSLRVCLFVTASLFTVASAVFALRSILFFPQLFSSYQALGAGIVGVVVLTLIQMAFLPNLLIWTASWLFGSGMYIAQGAHISMFSAQEALLPAIPIFITVPSSPAWWGLIGVVVVVAASALGTFLYGKTFSLAVSYRRYKMLAFFVSSVAATAGVWAFFAHIAGGSFGPGLLQQWGPQPGSVFVWIAFEVAIGACIGFVCLWWQKKKIVRASIEQQM